MSAGTESVPPNGGSEAALETPFLLFWKFDKPALYSKLFIVYASSSSSGLYKPFIPPSPPPQLVSIQAIPAAWAPYPIRRLYFIIKSKHLPQQTINDQVFSQPHRPTILTLAGRLFHQLGQFGLSPLVNLKPSIFPAFLPELHSCLYPALEPPLGIDGSPLTTQLSICHPELLVLPVGFSNSHGELVGVHLPVGLFFAVSRVVIDSLLGEPTHYSQLLIIIGFATVTLRRPSDGPFPKGISRDLARLIGTENGGVLMRKRGMWTLEARGGEQALQIMPWGMEGCFGVFWGVLGCFGVFWGRIGCRYKHIVGRSRSQSLFHWKRIKVIRAPNDQEGGLCLTPSRTFQQALGIKRDRGLSLRNRQKIKRGNTSLINLQNHTDYDQSLGKCTQYPFQSDAGHYFTKVLLSIEIQLEMQDNIRTMHQRDYMVKMGIAPLNPENMNTYQ